MKTLKRTVYDHGGSRIWFEDEKGNRELVADTYGQPFTDIIFEAIKASPQEPLPWEALLDIAREYVASHGEPIDKESTWPVHKNYRRLVEILSRFPERGE